MPSCYKFGEFTLDVKGRRLLRGKTQIGLGHRALPVLLFLIQQRNRIVGYEELLFAHWGGEASDQNLVEQTVLRIRRKLEDDAEHPKYIQTVETVGYQFIAAVEEDPVVTSAPEENLEPELHDGLVAAVGTEPPDGSGSPTQVPYVADGPNRTRSSFQWLWAGLILCVVALFAIWRRPVYAPPRVRQIIPITQSNHVKLSPLISTGAKILFQEQINTGYRVVEVPSAGGDVTPLRIPLINPELCDLSPDGSTLLLRSLIRSRIDLNPVYLQSLVEGEPRRLGDIVAFESNWRPDGRSAIYSTGSDVYNVSIQGGGSRHLFRVRGSAYWFRFSPNGQRIRFNVIEPETDAVFIWEAGSDGSNPHRLWPEWQQQQCCGSWTPEGKYYLFQAVVDGAYQVFARREKDSLFSGANPQPVQLTFAPMSHRGPTASQDGRRIFVRAVLPRGELMRYDHQSQKFFPLLSNTYASCATFARDGKSLAYVSQPDNTLWRSTIEGGSPQQLTDKPLQAALPRWSPDGTQLAFIGRYPNSAWKIYLVPATGGAPQPLPGSGDENETDPDWSPNGQQLVFGRMPARLQSSPARVVVTMLNLRTKTRLVLPQSQGYFSPRWSPTSGQIAASHKDGDRIVIYDLGTQRWSTLAVAGSGGVDWTKGAGYLSWSNDGNFVYFSVAGKLGRSILRVRVRDRLLEHVTTLATIQQPSFLFGDWVGLAQDGSPLAVRNRSVEDIYALEWEVP